MNNPPSGINRGPRIPQPGDPYNVELKSKSCPPAIQDQINKVEECIKSVISGKPPENDTQQQEEKANPSAVEQSKARQSEAEARQSEAKAQQLFYSNFIVPNQKNIQILAGVMRFIIQRVFGEQANPASVISDNLNNLNTTFTEEEKAFILHLLKNYGFNASLEKIIENEKDFGVTTSNFTVSLVKRVKDGSVPLQDQPIIKALAFCIMYEMFTPSLRTEDGSVKNRRTDQQEGTESPNIAVAGLNDPNFSALWFLYSNLSSKLEQIVSGDIERIGIPNCNAEQLKEFLRRFENSIALISNDSMSIFFNRVAHYLHVLESGSSSNGSSGTENSDNQKKFTAYDYFFNPIINILQVTRMIIVWLKDKKDKSEDKKG